MATSSSSSIATATSWRRCPAEIVDFSCTALRGYAACTSGDERFTAQNFFRKLDELGPHSKSSEIFRSGAFSPPGAKKE
jgi:hypothetical protein